MKVEKRFLPSIWQDEFQLPGKFQLAIGVLSLVNDQVFGLINAIRFWVSCLRAF